MRICIELSLNPFQILRVSNFMPMLVSEKGILITRSGISRRGMLMYHLLGSICLLATQQTLISDYYLEDFSIFVVVLTNSKLTSFSVHVFIYFLKFKLNIWVTVSQSSLVSNMMMNIFIPLLFGKL